MQKVVQVHPSQLLQWRFFCFSATGAKVGDHARAQEVFFERSVRRLSLWEEQQLQQPLPPHIPLAPPIVFADGAHLIAEAYFRDFFHSDRKNRSLRVVHFRRFLGMSGTGRGSPVVSQLRIAPCVVVRNSTCLPSFVHVAPCPHWKCT